MEVYTVAEHISIYAATSENVQADMCTKRRFRSACTFAWYDQNIQWVCFGLSRKQSMPTKKTSIRLSGCAGQFNSSL